MKHFSGGGGVEWRPDRRKSDGSLDIQPSYQDRMAKANAEAKFGTAGKGNWQSPKHKNHPDRKKTS